VSRWQRPVASIALGWARHGREMTPGTLLPWLCNVKPLIAVAFCRLWEDGLVSPDDAVSRVIPEFGRGGKAGITFRHVLTHTAGIKRDPGRALRFEPRDRVLEVIYDTPATPGMTPGLVAKYSVFWGWAVICEAIRRLTGCSYERYLETGLLDGTVTDLWPQMGPDLVAAHIERFGLLFGLDTAQPYPWPTKARLDHYDRDQPATSLIATAESVGHVYEAILASRWIAPTTTDALVARHRVGLYCENFRGFVSWGLGVVADGSYFGSYCSPRAFGHKGLNSSFAFADPEYGLVVTFICNGLIDGDVSDARDRLVAECVYRDLGIGEGLAPPPRIVAVRQARMIVSARTMEMPDRPPPREDRS